MQDFVHQPYDFEGLTWRFSGSYIKGLGVSGFGFV